MNSRRRAFTLFELILAIALTAALLAIIGTAINLYLTHVEASRNRVEEAQLARSILAMIADDLRGTAVYQPQDTSSVEQLMASNESFDVDSIDEERDEDSSGDDGDSTSGSGGGTTAGGAGGSSGIGSSGLGESESGGEADVEEDMPLGVTGNLAEMYIDVARLPGGDELFSTYTGYTNAPMIEGDGTMLASATGAQSATLTRPSDLKTVRYFVREGDRLDASGVAATSLRPDLQSYAGGLVRQEIPRASRLMAESMGETAVLESGQKLIAPEVVSIEFRYFDGQQVTEIWEMAERKSLPVAVEVSIWLDTANGDNASSYDAMGGLATARQYRQTVFLPMAELSQSGGGGGSGEASASSGSTSSSMGSSSSGSTSSGTSGFGQQSP